MTNETGSYPGQGWLWLYTFWYRIWPFSTSANADVLVWGSWVCSASPSCSSRSSRAFASLPRQDPHLPADLA